MGAQQSNASPGAHLGRPDSGIGLDFRGASSPTLKRAFPAPPIGYTSSGDSILELLPRGPDGRFRLGYSEDASQKFTVQCVENPLLYLADTDSPRSTYDFNNNVKRLAPNMDSPFIPSVCTDSEDSDSHYDADADAPTTTSPAFQSGNEVQPFGFPPTQGPTPGHTTKSAGTTTLGKLAPRQRRSVDDDERDSDGTGFMAFLEELAGHAETSETSSVCSAATTFSGFGTGTDSFGRRTEIRDGLVPRMCDSSSQTERSLGRPGTGMADHRSTVHSSSTNSSYSGFGESSDDATAGGARMSFEVDDTGADGSCDDSDGDDGYIEMNVSSRPTSQPQSQAAPQGSPKSIRQWPAAVGREGVRLTVMEERVDKMHRQVQSSQDRLAAWLKTKDTGASKQAQADAKSIPAIPAVAIEKRRSAGTGRRLPTKPTSSARTLPTPPKLVLPHRPGPSMYEKRLLLKAAMSTR